MAFVAFNFVLTGRLLVVPGPEALARRNLKLAGAGYADEDHWHDASGPKRSKTAPSPRGERGITWAGRVAIVAAVGVVAVSSVVDNIPHDDSPPDDE